MAAAFPTADGIAGEQSHAPGGAFTPTVGRAGDPAARPNGGRDRADR